MDQQRGRSPSAGHQQSHISRTHSPSPQHAQDNAGSIGLGLALDPTSGNNQQFGNGNLSSNNGLPSYTNNDFLNQQNSSFQQSDFGNPNYVPNQDFTPQFKQEDQSSQFQSPQRSFTQELLSANLGSNFNEGDFSLFSTPSGQGEQFEQNYFVNEDPTQPSNASVNPAELNMSSPPNNAPTPPGLLQPGSHSPSSAHQSPSFNQGQFQASPGHSRNASLGPESAAFPQGSNQVDWSMMPPQFTTHRRTPSEYSEVSASSANHSPNLGHHDTFDSIEQHHSPMQNPQDAGIYNEVLGIGSFSLSDPQVARGVSPGRGFSPAHSPAISPRLGPQQLPNVNASNQFLLGMNSDFGAPQNIYGQQEAFPQIQQPGDMGQAPQMVPPEINVEFAPASRQNSFDPPKPSFDQDALTPPERGRRRRAVSDPYNSISTLPRQSSPSSISPGPRSELSVRSNDSHRSLSPNDRSGASSPSRRRQSTSAIPGTNNRDYILGLADPDYQAASADNGNSKRVQKHPATFQCTLCPKRFTRAYNLRSHLRTHTDERPFVCTVCGKAFARQHDRKRHEGLHSGEKKFVCKGELKQGGQWGCGRRFARADALGRHFRSEAGRICIKPLLDEEQVERQRLWQEQRMQNNMQHMPMEQPFDASGNYTLPQSLLVQYPSLATLNWSELAENHPDEDLSDNRSSFDASGSEYYDEGDESGYLSSGPGPQQGYNQGQMNQNFNGYASAT